MEAIDWAASAMSAARSRLDIAAENLANGSSDGFTKRRARGELTPFGVRIRSERDGGPGPLRHTGRDLDLAIAGAGAFSLRGPDGRITQARSGAFVRDRFGHLVDDRQRVLLGERGPIAVPQGASIAPDGWIERGNTRLGRIPLPAGSSVRSGFLQASNVDAIGEMIDVLAAQRSFETAQKVLTAIDKTRERATTQVSDLK